MHDSDDDADEKKSISVKIHVSYIQKMKELQKEGPYATRSEIIRRALHDWFELRETKKRERERELKQ